MTPAPPTPTMMPTQATLLPLSHAPLPTGILDPPFTSPSFVRRGSCPRTFNPKYDLIEFPDSFSLHGELPGVQQEDIEVLFTDPRTMTIRGRSERSYTSDAPALGPIKEIMTSSAVTEGGQASTAHETAVEDTYAENKQTYTTIVQPPQQSQQRYWLSERLVGEFTRSFIFHVRVDQDHVRASMKNGLISVVVPKAQEHESCKIPIS